MAIPHPNELKSAARRSLELAPENRRLVLIFSGASAAASLLVAVLNFLLSTGIAGTGGLAGMGLRSVLSTAQTMLELALLIIMPFWTMGYIFTAMKLARRADTAPKDLFEGFRRLGAVLRLMLLQALVLMVVSFVCMQVGATVLSLTPLGAAFQELSMTMDPQLLLYPDEATLLLMMDALMPVIIGSMILMAAGCAVVAYFLRLSSYFLLDDPRGGAIRAMVSSFRAMRGNCLKMLRLDFSWWWYYVLELLTAAVCFGDLWLPLLGIELPFSEDAAYFVFYILGMVLQLLLHLQMRNTLECTYIQAYDALRPNE